MGHHLKKFQRKKAFWVKSFWVSVVLMILVCIIATMGFDFFSDLVYRFYNIEQEDYAKILVNASVIWKILILQFTLVPAIAMCMMEKHLIEEEMDD